LKPHTPVVQPASLIKIYQLLLKEYGEQNWWPADTPFEVALGAILTQNTAWGNVEKAISSLKHACALTPESVISLSEEELQAAIRPSGYFRQKAERLRALCRFLIDEYKGDLSLTVRSSIKELRQQFLALKGIGPETADSILLYALDRSVFVVDAYTVRLFSRLGLCEEKMKYGAVQALFTDNLEPDVKMFNEYHALVVLHCKLRCTKREPSCNVCPLRGMCAWNSKFQSDPFNIFRDMPFP